MSPIELSNYVHVIAMDKASPWAGGIQNMAYWMAITLSSQRLRVVLAGCIHEDVARALHEAGVETVPLKRPFRSRHGADLGIAKLLLRLRARLGCRVLFYSMVINNVRITRWLHGMLGWECVAFLHGNEILRLLARRPGTLRRSIRHCRAVFANSRYAKSLVGQLGEFDNVHVVSPGIPASVYCGTRGSDLRGERRWEGRKIILTIGRLNPRKGYGMLLDVMARLVADHPDLLLLVVGDGRYRAELETLVEAVGLSEHVLLLGRVDEREKIDLIDACDVFCMPSEHPDGKFEVEGFGIVFLEVAARGRVAIGTNSGGIPDAIEDGRSGLLIEPGDIDTLKARLEDVLYAPQRYEFMREYARERACGQFTWERQVKRMLGLIAGSENLTVTNSKQ